MKKYSTYVGLDIHKNSISIAIAEGGRQGAVRYYGSINGELASLEKVIKKIDKEETELNFVYEAGPCGYEIYRHLTKRGYHCTVVAPSKNTEAMRRQNKK